MLQKKKKKKKKKQNKTKKVPTNLREFYLGMNVQKGRGVPKKDVQELFRAWSGPSSSQTHHN